QLHRRKRHARLRRLRPQVSGQGVRQGDRGLHAVTAPVIAIDRVSKTFGARRALDTVSFEIARGEILTILGHNGAGKTTLFALALGLLRFSAGDIVVDGVSVRADARAARRRIGSVIAPAFYEYLSGWTNLRILTSYSGGAAPEELAAAARFVGLA